MYRDDASARRMTLLWSASNSMTLDLCANIAFSEQRLVFGVEGGSDCLAGECLGALGGPGRWDQTGLQEPSPARQSDQS